MIEYICYVIVKDLPTMSPGKACAQVHHAGTHMACDDSTAYRVWADQGEFGTNTTIVLRANVEEFELYKQSIAEAYVETDLDNWTYGLYTDPTYPTTKGRTLEMTTTMWLVGAKTEIKPLVEGLPLY